MTREPPIPETVSLHIPFRVVTRGGRKEMHLPEGATHSRRTDNTLVKALARAFRWKRMLESGEFATIAELHALPAMLTALRLPSFHRHWPSAAELTREGSAGGRPRRAQVVYDRLDPECRFATPLPDRSRQG